MGFGKIRHRISIAVCPRLTRTPCCSCLTPPPSQNVEVVEVEKDKKRCLEFYMMREAVLPILDCLENILENAV